MQEGAWYRLVIAIVTALVVFSNQFFGTHISTADAVSAATAGVALILAEAAVLHGKAGKTDPAVLGRFLEGISTLLRELASNAQAQKTTVGVPLQTQAAAATAGQTIAPAAAPGTAADGNTGDKIAHDA